MKLIVYRRNKRKLEYTLRYEYYMQQSLVCTDSTRNPSSNKKVKKSHNTPPHFLLVKDPSSFRS